MRNKVYISDFYNPYKNLALEKLFLETIKPDEIIFYLWQNEKTVVIGKNQNAWQEVNIEKLHQDHGTLARRLSGGGAVYHDLGNLNFTFVSYKDHYDVKRQLSVILRALSYLGLSASMNGRNDLEIEGYKFSGNAYYQTQDRCYHHGTLLVHVQLEDLSKYLQVSPLKLQAKGVHSVRSRVKNLNSFNSKININSMKQACLQAFEDIYGPYEIIQTIKDQQKWLEYENKMSLWEWNYGKSLPFEREIKKRFIWGDICLQFHVEKGIVEDLNVYSDSLYPDYIDSIQKNLVGCRYELKEILERLEEHELKQDLSKWLCQEWMEEGK